MNYERNKYEQRSYDRVRIASKKIGSYALAVGLIPFFNIFGFTLNNVGLAILFFVLFFLEIWSIIRFITFNHKLKKSIKIELIEDFFLLIGCIIAIILSLLFVQHDYEEDKLMRIIHSHAEFWIIDFVIMLIGGFVLAKRTKRIH